MDVRPKTATKEARYIELKEKILDLVMTSDQLDPFYLQQLTDFLKEHKELLLRKAYEFIFKYMEKKNSQVRLNCLYLVEHFFSKSLRFREWTVDDVHTLVDLCICAPKSHRSADKEAKDCLPPPASIASLLRNEALRVIHRWFTKYQWKHRRLQMLYAAMKEHYGTFLGKLEDEALRREQIVQDKLMIEEVKKKKLIEKAFKNFNAAKPEIELHQQQSRSCLDMLELGSQNAAPECSSASYSKRRLVENSDNREIITSLEESRDFLKKSLPLLRDLVSKNHFETDFERLTLAVAEQMKKEIEDFLMNLDNFEIVRVHSKVSASFESGSKRGGISSDSESDLEEVAEKEGIEFMTETDISETARSLRPGPLQTEINFSIDVPQEYSSVESTSKKRPRRQKTKLASQKSMNDTPKSRLSKKLKKSNIFGK